MTNRRRLDRLIQAIRMKKSILQARQFECQRRQRGLQSDLHDLENLNSIHGHLAFALMPTILRRQIVTGSELLALDSEAAGILQDILKLELFEKNLSRKLKEVRDRQDRVRLEVEITEREASKLHASLEQGIRVYTR